MQAQQLPPPQQQMNPGIGGPQWANPNGAAGVDVGVGAQQQQQQYQQQQAPSMAMPMGATPTTQQHENEFFAPLSTLDEPVMETIMRDVRSVGSKLKVVLLPMERSVRSVLHRVSCIVLCLWGYIFVMTVIFVM